jgi:Myb-like DNA-binding domain
VRTVLPPHPCINPVSATAPMTTLFYSSRCSQVNPGIRKEKWSADEDHQLAALVAEHGNRWADIAKQCAPSRPRRGRIGVLYILRPSCPFPVRGLSVRALQNQASVFLNVHTFRVDTHSRPLLCSIPGRTDQQCMGRWRRHLDPNIRKCQWQSEEDVRLKQLYIEFGPQWSNISKRLSGRTAQQCRARWFQLCPSEQGSAAPALNRATHGHRRDRHHDGPSIQASAKLLLEQMSVTGQHPTLGASVQDDDERRHAHADGAHTSGHQRHRRSRSLQGMYLVASLTSCKSFSCNMLLSCCMALRMLQVGPVPEELGAICRYSASPRSAPFPPLAGRIRVSK